jgi:LPXTG-site transpeptidase (sortase) family protein
MPTGGSEGVEQDASPVTRVVIPGLNLEARVRYVPFEGLSWPVEGLREDVAWLGNTSWPGLGSNTVLAGHVTVQGLGDGPFRYLEELETGDEIVVYTEKGVYTYAVREQMTVDETHLGVTMPTIRPQLTLITCTGWDTELSIYRFRRVVVADLIRNELVERQGKTR